MRYSSGAAATPRHGRRSTASDYAGAVIRVDKAEDILEGRLDRIAVHPEDRAGSSGPSAEPACEVHLDAADAGNLLDAVEFGVLLGQRGLVGGAATDLGIRTPIRPDDDHRCDAADRLDHPFMLARPGENIVKAETDRRDQRVGADAAIAEQPVNMIDHPGPDVRPARALGKILGPRAAGEGLADAREAAGVGAGKPGADDVVETR